MNLHYIFIYVFDLFEISQSSPTLYSHNLIFNNKILKTYIYFASKAVDCKKNPLHFESLVVPTTTYAGEKWLSTFAICKRYRYSGKIDSKNCLQWSCKWRGPKPSKYTALSRHCEEAIEFHRKSIAHVEW